MYERERGCERGCVYVCMCERERGKIGVHINTSDTGPKLPRERESVCICVRESVCEKESVC